MKQSPLNKQSKKHKAEGPRRKRWEQAVFERDDWRCQNKDCKMYTIPDFGSINDIVMEEITDAHHIWEKGSHPEWRFVLENGITLCRICHGLVHDKKIDLPVDRDVLREEFRRDVGTIIE